MTCSRMLLSMALLLAGSGCENPQTVTENIEPSTPTAPAIRPTVATEKSASQGFSATDSGLKYKITRAGDPARKPTQFSTVLAHYKGWLDDGTIFDSSYDRGEPAEFALNEVVAGWTEGLQLIGEGGEIELEIPGKLGYGPHGRPDAGIGPNATLHFKVELLEIR